MSTNVPPNPQVLLDALNLSEDILADLELNRIPLSSIALKASRLARLINDHDIQLAMAYEASGYPHKLGKMPPDSWRLSAVAGRRYVDHDKETGEQKEYAYLESIEQLEEQLKLAKLGFDAARDPDVSITSANPSQFLHTPQGNYLERRGLRDLASQASQRLAGRRSFIHQYVSRIHYELKFSGVASEIFSRIRNRVDSSIASLVPDAVRRFSAIYENLRSENPEDWSNAVHSCRRIMKDLADAVFPPQEEDRVIHANREEKRISLGPDNYVNRIMCFVDDNSESGTTKSIVGSHLVYLGDRLDAVVSGAQKGSHSDIVSREEADRIVVHTYLLVGDVLSIWQASRALSKNDDA